MTETNNHILDRVEEFVSRFVAYPTIHARTAHVLWIAHAHLVDVFDNTPRLAALSPEPGSGKTRLLEITEPLVPRPVITVNATPAYVFRKISDPEGLPTLLFDEVDAIFNSRKADANEDLRGLLNSGYRRGATAGRATVRGKEVVTEDWPSFSAVALAELNLLPDTLMTRSIVIHMKRRRADEKVQPYRRRVYAQESNSLYVALADWSNNARPSLQDVWPELPEGIEDRDADVWEPIIAVSDVAGGLWPKRAREAALFFVEQARDRPATLGIKLLTDIKFVLGDRDRISTQQLLEDLHAIETSPWNHIKGEPIDSRFLSQTLAKYAISPRKIRINAGTLQGYLRSDLADAFGRYVPAHTSETTEHPEHPEQTAPNLALVPLVPDVPQATGRKAAS